MTRVDYIATLLDLLRLLQGVLDRDHETRDGNYVQLVNLIEMFLPIQTVDGGVDPVRTMSIGYLDRVRYLRRTSWERQSELCHEWSMVVLTLAKED